MKLVLPRKAFADANGARLQEATGLSSTFPETAVPADQSLELLAHEPAHGRASPGRQNPRLNEELLVERQSDVACRHESLTDSV
jgi:hypothetical protein